MRPELVAHHLTEADSGAASVRYWRLAGARAFQRSELAEAVAHARRGLDVLASLPPGAERAHEELGLQTTLGPALMSSLGYAAPEVREAYMRARELCAELGETPELFPALCGLAIFYLASGDHPAARELGEQLQSLASEAEDPALQLEADFVFGVVLLYTGHFAKALHHLERGYGVYDRDQHHRLTFRYGGLDPGATCLAQSAWALWVLGRPDEAAERNEAALQLCRELGHPFTLARALTWASQLHQLRHEPDRLEERATEAFDISKERGFALVRGQVPIMLGWTLAARGRADEGSAASTRASRRGRRPAPACRRSTS